MTTLASRLDAIRVHGGFSAEVVDAFGRFVETAADDDLFRMSPLRYAAQVGLAQQVAIDLFLHATHAGVLEFSWGVLCPGCAAFLTTPGGLRSLAGGRVCHLCQMQVDRPLDDDVEVAFSVSPGVRTIRFHDMGALDLERDLLRTYFSTSLPAAAPFHAMLAGQLLRAGRVSGSGVAAERLDLEAGRYFVMFPSSHSLCRIAVGAGGPAEATVELYDDRVIPESLALGSGESTLRLDNRSSRPMAFALLRDPLPPACDRSPDMKPPEHALLPYLGGQRLIATQAFRDLFRSESIPSDGGLELRSLTLLFTDLKGSTALYEAVGDLRAYDRVRTHFGILRRVVAERGGAIVKTIGDAIMASFWRPELALDAAAAMHRELGREAGGDLFLKIGLHSGSCIAVELNDRLDYFGRTVNLAARVQGIAEACEVVCTASVWEVPAVREAAAAAGLVATAENAHLKGIDGDVPVVRLRQGP